MKLNENIEKTEHHEKKTERLVARVSLDIQQTIQKAAAYSGASVTQFIVDSAMERAKSVINDIDIIKLSNKASLRMMELLDNPPEPNAFLTKAKANYDKNIKNA
jgi:uncharacterized protein (DUF1778 family)